MAVVDPFIIGFTSVSSATDYSIQRKVFSYGGRFWAFWYDGANIGYASSRNGEVWSASMSTGSGAIVQGFDVDQRDGVFLVGYVASDSKSLNVLRGITAGSFITWSPVSAVHSWTEAGAGLATVAIGSDGYYWAGASHSHEDGTKHVSFVRRSTVPGSVAFSDSFSLTDFSNPSKVAMRVLALPNGGAYLITAKEGGSTLFNYRYTSSGWSSNAVEHVIDRDTASHPGDTVSASALPDGRIRVVYRHTSGGLYTYAIKTNDGGEGPSSLDSRDSRYPTLGIDLNGDSHVYYLHSDGGGDHIFYVRTLPTKDVPLEWPWSAPEEPFATTSYQRRSLTAAPLAIGFVGLIWTLDTGSFSVQFGAVATPLDLIGQLGEPWNRQGLSPYQGYFGRFGEHVSPGNGRLTVKHTDLVLPGRRIDLVLSRVFTTPRAFAGGPVPYLHENNSAAYLGEGWQLDLPWITSQYVHLWNGQMYVLKWRTDTTIPIFENHEGEHFRLYHGSTGYSLYARSGTYYRFDEEGRLLRIQDPTGNSTISFTYGADGLSTISDTTGRVLSFAYHPDGTLQSVTSGGRTTSYSYVMKPVSGSNKPFLSSVIDPLGRETQFEYNDANSPYLLTAVRYSTGGATEYTWGSFQAGPDLTTYLVIEQETVNATGGSLRSNSFDYEVLNGKVSYSEVRTYGAGVLQGSTTVHFDGLSRRVTTTRRDSAYVQMAKDVAWFGSSGGPERVDVYPGTSGLPAHSLHFRYDDWGNLIYSRDAIGHERFGSYLNTRHQGGFFAPGRLNLTDSGLLFFDDFEDRDLSDWSLTGSAYLDYASTGYESLPPSLRLLGGAEAEHAFAAQDDAFWMEGVVQPAAATGAHHVRLLAAGVTRADIRFGHAQIQRKSGSQWVDVMPYSANQWYRVALHANSSASTAGEYDLFINGVLKTTASLLGSGSPDQIEFATDGSSTMNVDMVKVYDANPMTISGLSAGQFVSYYNAQGRREGTWRADGGSLGLLSPPARYRFDSSDEGFAKKSDYPGSEVGWDSSLGRIDVTSDRTDAGDEMFAHAVEPLDPGTPFTATARWATTQQGNWQVAYPLYLGAGSNNQVGTANAVYFLYASRDSYNAWNPYYYLRYIDGSGTFRINVVYEAQANTEYHFFIRYNATSKELTLELRDSGDTTVASGNYTIGSSPNDGFLLDEVGVSSHGWSSSSEPVIRGWVDDITLLSPQLSGAQLTFPHGTLHIYDAQGTLEYVGPTHEFWAGDKWAYTPPWWEAPERVRDGYLRWSSIYLDDSTNAPTATYQANEDGWLWGPYDFPPWGAESHRSPSLTHEHGHLFADATPTLLMISGDFHVQYVYLSANQVPSQIMLEFRDTQDSWDHRAYWGQDIICWGQPCQNSQTGMGNLPSSAGRWTMLIAKADDIGTSDLWIEGLAYKLYGGAATWDFSARGDWETGTVQVSGMLPGWTAEICNTFGDCTTSPPVPSGSNTAVVDVYDGTVLKVRAFPFEGHILVRDGAGSGVYKSPLLTLWGGDVYYNGQANFYPNTEANPEIHDRLVARLEFQTGRGASPEVRQETHLRYTYEGLPDRIKVRDGTSWRETTLGYDGTYGIMTSVTDPLLNAVSYEYSPTYGNAYVTTVRDDLGNADRAAYDPDTGWQLSARDPLGRIVRYQPDVLGRLVAQQHFDAPASSEALYMDMEWTTEEATPRLEDLSVWGNHGTIVGTASVAGKVGLARDFDGTVNDYISIPDDPSLDISSAVTVAAWVKPEGPNGGGWGGIWFDQATPVRSRFMVHDNGQVLAQFRIGGVDRSFATGSGEVPAGVFSHVAYTYDGGTERIYVNGVERASQASSGSLSLSGLPRLVGRGYNAAGGETYFLHGLIDELRVLDRALIPQEITSLYDGSYGRLARGEIAYDDGENVLTSYDPTTQPRRLHLDLETLLTGKLEDLSGYGNHATLNGTTDAAGMWGRARQFDGVDDYLDTEDAPFDFGFGDFTVAFWAAAPNGVSGVSALSKGAYFQVSPGYHVSTAFNPADLLFEVSDSSTRTWARFNSGVSWSGFQHFVAVKTAAQIQTYLDGVLQETKSHAIGSVDNPFNLLMGQSAGTAGKFFEGTLDEAQVFDRALSDAEVQALYDGTETGHYEKRYHDSLGRTTRVVQRDLFGTEIAPESFAYDFRDRVVKRTSPMGFDTTWEYDFLGRLTKTTHPDLSEHTVTHDDVTRLVTVVAENGRQVAYRYDLAGRTTVVREYYDASNYHATSYAYDEAGNLLQVTNALGHATSHEYDDLNRLTKTIYPDATKFEVYTYDEVGNLKTRQDRAGSVTAYVYDDLYRLQSIDHPETAEDVTFSYDANGNLLSVSTPGTTVDYTYDPLDRILTETTVLGASQYPLAYTYDLAGRLTQLTYPDGFVLSYGYDALGRTAEVSSGASTYAAFAYHADGLVKDITLANGIVQSYAYNDRRWPTSIQATTGATPYLDLAYTYDASGNVLSENAASFTYDALDRLTIATGGFGSRTYTYDAVGNRLAEDRGSDWYTLRPNGNGDSIQWTQVPASGWNYDKVDEASGDGDATYVRASSGTPTDLYHLGNLPGTGGAAIESVAITAVARYVEGGGGGPPPCKFPPCPVSAPIIEPLADSGSLKLALKTNGQVRTSVARGLFSSYAGVGWTLTTNPVTGQPWTAAEVNALQAGVQLVSTTNEVRVTQVYVTVQVADETTYVYDPLGMNELASLSDNGATTTFTYDANGNLLSKAGGGSTWSYAWNAENLLTEAMEDGVPQEAYTYDGLGRRVKVEGASPSEWTVTILAGQEAIYEVDQAGAATKYVRANGMLLAKITESGQAQYYLGDHLGSTRQVRDANRDLVFSAEYEPFGEMYSVTGSEAYKFTGEHYDDPTGLVYLRARQYDPELGRFISADPILGSPSWPQTLNAYAYVANNPLRYTDPSGELPSVLIGALIGAAAGAVIYTVHWGFTTGWDTSQWSWGDFGRSVGVGALAGAVAGLAGPQAGYLVWVGAGAASGATGYAADRGIEAAQTGSLEWSWADLGMSVGIGAAAGAAGKWIAGKLLNRALRGNQAIDDLVRGRPPGTAAQTRLSGNWLVRGSGGEAPVLGRWWGTQTASSRGAYRSLYSIDEQWGNSLRRFSLGFFRDADASISVTEALPPYTGGGVQVKIPTAQPRFYIIWPWF